MYCNKIFTCDAAAINPVDIPPKNLPINKFIWFEAVAIINQQKMTGIVENIKHGLRPYFVIIGPEIKAPTGPANE